MSTIPAYAFGMSEYTTTPATFEQDLDMYTDVGVDAIEICQFKLDPTRAGDQIRQAIDRGLPVSSFQPQVHSIYPDTMAMYPVAPADRMEKFRELIDIVAPIVPGAVLVSITGPAVLGDFKSAISIAIREYRALAAYAEDKGVRIALEPLNPILMNVDSFIGSIPEALEIVHAVDSKSFGMWLDVWHYWQDFAWRDHVANCAGKIFGVHVSDWRRPSAFGDRLTIGTGEIPIPEMIRVIHETGYRGVYTAELFFRRFTPGLTLWNGDLTKLVADNKKGFAVAWQTAFAN